MISTRDLSSLPDIPGLRRLTRALAALDAILAPAAEYRYYRFDSRWSDSDMMASMSNGSGDEWHALFCPAGVAFHGLAHEAPTFKYQSPVPGMFEGLPKEFHDNFLHEPAFDTANTTFCLWRRTTDPDWRRGPVQLPPGADPDGSGDLLTMFTGDPKQYVQFAADYYEREIDVALVRAVYAHVPLTDKLVRRLNPEVDLSLLKDDLAEIGYPEAG
jgi:hypothetical protein